MSNVNLRLVDDETLLGESLHSGHLGGGAGCRANDEVGFEANAIDLDALGEDAFDEIAGGGVLRARIFDAVVVVDELRGEAGRFGGLGGEFEGLSVRVSGVLDG
jgi:hypothetical protein